jgi:hypothetical protein
MDTVMVFGFLTAFLTLVIWLHQGRSRLWTTSMAACLAGLAVYAFMAGAWPVGMVEIVWSAATLRRWRLARNGRLPMETRLSPQNHWKSESRMSRMFGSSGQN